MMTLRDERQRLRATTSLGETLLVEASAGTGKTTTMVHRLVALLTTPPPGGGEPPSLREVVAITFTERAAQELKDRLRAALFASLPTTDERARRRLVQALGDLEQAPIGTIHSFCSRILRQYPIEAGVDVQFAVADERTANEIEAKLWEEWIVREFQRPAAPEVLCRALEMELGLPTLRRVARALLSRRAWPVRELIERQPAEINWETEIRELERQLSNVEREDPETGIARSLSKKQREIHEQMAAWLSRLSAMPQEERTTFILGSPPFKENKTTRPFCPVIRRLRAAITHPFVTDLVRWLDRPAESPDGPGFLREYDRAKDVQGLLDFDDLLIRARDLVRGKLNVRRELQRQYRHIIMDEFQDTDPVQTELIVWIAQQPSDDDATLDVPWTRAKLAPGRLCVVGDPKQSIYRFRGADIEAYSQVAELIGGEGTCHLEANFRSHVDIIEAVNAIFAQPEVFRHPDTPAVGLSFQPVYRALVPNPNTPKGGTSPRVRWLVPDGDAFETKLGTGRPIEAKLVAAAIREIVVEGRLVTDPDTKAIRPARWGDVAVLYRSSRVLDHFEREFRRQGIPYRVISGKTFFEREEIARLISVLTAIEQPGDALNVVAALRSPFFGVSDADLATGALVARSRFDYRDELPEALPDSLREAFLCLRELHRQRREKAPAALVQELYERTKVLAVYAQTGDGEQAVANLLKVLDEARRLERDGPVPFRRVTEHLLALRQEGGEEGEATLEDEGGQRVRLLTIHKAKGLEFPIVVVIDLAAQMDGGSRNQGPELVSIRTDSDGAPSFALNVNVSFDDAPLCTVRWHELKEEDDKRQRAEAIRLLYVALTRARDYLILPKVVQKNSNNAAKESKSWQDIVERTPGSNTWPRWTPCTDADRSVGLNERRALQSSDQELLRSQREELVRRRAERTKTGTKVRVRVRRPSLHEAERGTTDEEAPPVGVEEMSPERDEGRRLGTVVHAALERLNPGDEGRIPKEIDLLAPEQRLSEESRRRAMHQTMLALNSELVRRAARASRRWKEVPVILCEERDGETTVTRGICDLVFEHEGGLVLVDYKTDRSTPEEVPRLVEKYRSQVLEYARALEIATGRTVIEAWLCFLGIGEAVVEECVERRLA